MNGTRPNSMMREQQRPACDCDAIGHAEDNRNFSGPVHIDIWDVRGRHEEWLLTERRCCKLYQLK
jgi:hypothetical protein